MVRPVVAGVDGSPESADSARWAVREASRRGTSLRLVHAVEGLPPEGPRPRLPELSAPLERAHRLLRAVVDDVAAHTPHVPVSADLIPGTPGEALLREASGAALLVLGSRGFGAVGGRLAGSAAAAVVGHARCPVVLVRAGTRERDAFLPRTDPTAADVARDVALALDLPGSGAELLDFAFGTAQSRGSAVRAVHVWHVPYAAPMPDAAQRAVLREDAELGLARLLRPWREKYPDVYVHEVLAEGRATHEVVRAAGGACLLVVGHHARPHPVGSRTGSVTHAAIHYAKCPVAVVPHDRHT
ncbi:universal stress protein [Streptomyces sp. NPDC046939]|uniref:universal stress protein n=1 Tax=Streptomyces sp. NPDC046939 TaxID=3155376 RepID=UPI0034113B73